MKESKCLVAVHVVFTSPYTYDLKKYKCYFTILGKS